MPLIRTHRWRLRLASTALACWVVISVSLSSACTIPVFRFALERWESDRFLVIVYHDDRLTTEQKSAIDELAQRSSLVGGPLNIEVVRYDLASLSPSKLLDVQPPSTDRPLPWVEVRNRLDRTRTALRWQGTLADAIELPGLFDSPARSETVRRILAGHSSVWLLIAPEQQSRQLSEQLQATLDEVTHGLALPQGIGLAGSELYSTVPLGIRYSVLPISHSDPQEQEFLKWLAAFTSEWRTDAAYVIPVFGRCRALDVIPYGEADAPLIDEVANFLCGACSCQVKQANPGFDLLTSVNWDQSLFGSSIPQHRHADSESRMPRTSEQPLSPEFLAIPSGNRASGNIEPAPIKESANGNANDSVDGGASTAFRVPYTATTLRLMPNLVKSLIVLVVLTLFSGGILSGAILVGRWLTGRKSR